MCGDNVPLNCYFSEENCTLKRENVVLGRLCSWCSNNVVLPLRKGDCSLLSTEKEEEGKNWQGEEWLKISQDLRLFGLQVLVLGILTFLEQVKLFQISSAFLSSDFCKSDSRSEDIPHLNPNFAAHLSVSYPAQKL